MYMLLKNVPQLSYQDVLNLISDDIYEELSNIPDLTAIC